MSGVHINDKGSGQTYFAAGRDKMADRDWCATCRRRPCRRYAQVQMNGKRWCQAYEYTNRGNRR